MKISPYRLTSLCLSLVVIGLASATSRNASAKIMHVDYGGYFTSPSPPEGLPLPFSFADVGGSDQWDFSFDYDSSSMSTKQLSSTDTLYTPKAIHNFTYSIGTVDHPFGLSSETFSVLDQTTAGSPLVQINLIERKFKEFIISTVSKNIITMADIYQEHVLPDCFQHPSCMPSWQFQVETVFPTPLLLFASSFPDDIMESELPPPGTSLYQDNALEYDVAVSIFGFHETYPNGFLAVFPYRFVPTHFTISSVPLAAAVPEPRGWEALLLGFTALGGALRRARARVICAAVAC
jgi:hypothetical protein